MKGPQGRALTDGVCRYQISNSVTDLRQVVSPPRASASFSVSGEVTPQPLAVVLKVEWDDGVRDDICDCIKPLGS